MTLRARGFVLGLIAIFGLGPTLAFGEGHSQGNPRLDYMLQCQGCHRADGLGTPDAGIPSMIGLGERFLGDAEGRAYVVQVPGVSQAPLDDRAIAALLNWILDRFDRAEGSEAQGAFEPFTPAEVARYRAMEPIDVTATRARILERHAKRPARTN